MTNEMAIAVVGKSRTIRIYNDYSGRGMFGEKTTAIVGLKMAIRCALREAGIPLTSIRWDSMGKTEVVAY